MLGEVLSQIKPNGKAPPMQEDLQLSMVSKTSAEEGMNVTHTPITKGQNQEQEEVVVDDRDEAGQKTLALPSHSHRHYHRCCASR